MAEWTPSSWQNRPAGQQPSYPDNGALAGAVEQLASLPPLVTSWEVERLRTQLAEAAAGKRFLLQGGACAERFDQCSADIITNKLKILLQMSLVLTHGLKRRIIRVGRFAGQYAKPRSSDTEERDGVTLPSYRGEIVNGPGFTAEERKPDPERLLRGFEHAAMTLNFIRSLVDGGFADLHHPEYWDLDFVAHSPRAQEYQRVVENLSDSLQFMETLAGIQPGEMSRVDFYTSHEGLLLPYEQAVTRRVPRREGWYNLGTHFPWVGLRTAEVDGAHVDYFRGIRNPIGVKIGPTMTPEWLLELLEILDPESEPGRLTLVHRMGHAKVGDCLPPLIEAVQCAERTVLWCCDPMHGNTETTAGGRKTRRFENILSELEQSFEIHADLGSYQGGVHFELSGDNVTECIGGARGLSEVDLDRAYESRVDPRLNYEQALEMALLIGRKVAKMNGKA
ncbi:MAG: 3-deoxy-7-phosphoheptulonate synthase class II [Acidobacteria bacterium]|nr:3-deoxy-7-phosphoheptulonate synthase class II [Candidatus Sulfomarinibacter sp. MAG AM1]